MLQNNNSQRTERRASSVLEALSPAEFYAASVGFLRRQLSTLIFALLFGLSLGAIYILMTSPRYTGRAILIVDAPKAQFSQASAGSSPIDSATIDTQIEILNSENIAMSVIKELHLDADPEFVSTGAGISSAVSRFADRVIPDALKVGVPENSNLSNEPPAEDRALRAFQKRLKVKRVALTYAIEINFESRSPYRAAQIANTIADAYEIDAFEAKYHITDRAAKWLQERLTELREQTSNSERAVVDYKLVNNIVDTGGRLMNEQQLAEINSELIRARASTAEAKARLDRVQQIVSSDHIDLDATATATVAETLQNNVIIKMRERYLEEERRATQLASKYGALHLTVIDLHNDMRELQHTIFEELKRTAESFKSDYAIAKSREQSIQQSLDRIVAESHATDKAKITLHNLESSAQTYRDMYDNFLQRYMQSVQQQSSPVSESRLITHARPPLSERSPKPLLVMALAALGGLIFGATMGTLRDISDRVFRTTVQVGEHLQADCIAVVPLIKDSAGPDASFRKAKAASPRLPPGGVKETRSLSGVADVLPSPLIEATRNIIGLPQHISDWVSRTTTLGGAKPLTSLIQRHGAQRRHAISHDKNLCWTVANAPLSRFSESIRALKFAADSSNAVKHGNTIGITSALPNEGKSTVAVSLAALIAHGGGRAILVDCDLRNPALSRMLTPDAQAGLLEIIAGKAGLDDVLWREPTTGLTFLPTVLTSRLAHPSDLLASRDTRSIFRLLRKSYDYVIVDLSPLAPVVDVRVMAPLVDSFLFVVEWGRTDIDVVQLALSNARGVYDNLLGIVLNKVDMKAFGRYSNQETYYNNPYYSRYESTD